MEDLRENCPFESFGRIPGKQRQAISVSSLLLSFLSLSRYYDIFPYFLLLPYAFLFFLLRSGLSLFLSLRLLPLLVSPMSPADSAVMLPINPRVCFIHRRTQTSGGLPSLWQAPVESASRLFLRVSLWF